MIGALTWPDFAGGFQPLFAVSLDTIVFLVIVVVTLLGKLFGKKELEAEDEWPKEDTNSNRRNRASTTGSAGALDWEEEMRRLLEGKPPRDPGSVQPPPLVREIPRPSPPPLKSVPASKDPAHCVNEESHSLDRDSRSWDVESPSLDHRGSPQIQLASLSESASSYSRAQDLHEQVAARMREVDELRKRVPKLPGRRAGGKSADAAKVVTMLKSPQTARQAIIATMILGPSKAFES